MKCRWWRLGRGVLTGKVHTLSPFAKSQVNVGVKSGRFLESLNVGFREWHWWPKIGTFSMDNLSHDQDSF